MEKNRSRRNRGGQTLVEFALIIAFVCVVAVAVLSSTGASITSVFRTVNTQTVVAQHGGVVSGGR